MPSEKFIKSDEFIKRKTVKNRSSLKQVRIGFAKETKNLHATAIKVMGLKFNFQNGSVLMGISFWELSFELSEKFYKCEMCLITKQINH